MPTRVFSPVYLILPFVILLTSCNQPVSQANIPKSSPSGMPEPATKTTALAQELSTLRIPTITHVKSSTLDADNSQRLTLSVPSIPPTFIFTPSPVPPGVFALLFYPPLIMNYDTSIWKDELNYADHIIMVNYLQAQSLGSCKILVQGPIDFNQPPAFVTVHLGSIRYQVTTYKDSPAGLNTTLYIEDQTLAGYNYAPGLPIPVIQASPSEWDLCKSQAEKVLATLHSPYPSTMPLITPPVETATLASTDSPSGAMISGQIIAGYGDHRPFSELPLRIRQKNSEAWDTYTDGNGYFTLTNLPLGQVDIDDGHLTFQVTITSTSQIINLGKLRYPLIHPPLYYWWQAALLADLNELFIKGQQIPFQVCITQPDWVRPTIEVEREQVLSKRPFIDLGIQRYEKPAILYNTIDLTTQSFPDGLNLDALGAEWLYRVGLWNVPNPITHSNCSYDQNTLESLLNRDQLEVWLFGYNVVKSTKVVERFGHF